MKKPNPCPLLNPCLKFCPSPQADGHYILTDMILSFRVVVVSPAFGRDTNQKKWNTDWTEEHESVFSRIHFFDIIELMSFGFWPGFSWICKCCSTSFLGGIGVDNFVSNKKTNRILLSPKRILPYREQMGNIRAATMPKWGNVLAHVGQRACPKWARCLPRMGRFAVRHLPNKLTQNNHYAVQWNISCLLAAFAFYKASFTCF